MIRVSRAIIAVLLIPHDAIDDRAARGFKGEHDGDTANGWRVVIESKPLLILAAALALFHLGNGAMLPLCGLAVSAAKKGNPASLVAQTVVVAQAVMIVASIVAMRLAAKRGYWLVILIPFVALPLRGLVAASVIEAWGVFPVQTLDGIGAGLQSVTVPGLVARILAGTGRVNVGQGAVMSVQGAGAALSPAIGGWIAQHLGYSAAFLILGGFALGSLALWIGFAPLLLPIGARGEAPAATAT
jgi:MFS family permease